MITTLAGRRGAHWLPPSVTAVFLLACDAPRPTGPSLSAVASITLTIQSPIMAVGRSDPITTILRDSSGRTLKGLTPRWSSSDGCVVAVDSTGEVTALSPGSAMITATAGATDTSIAIDVAPATVPFLHRPFTGSYSLGTPLDHDLPLGFNDDNGVQVEWNGTRARPLRGQTRRLRLGATRRNSGARRR